MGKVHKLCNFIQIHSEACRIVFEESEKYLGQSGTFTNFETLFKIILKLGELLQLVDTWRVHRLCDYIQNHSEACGIFCNMWVARKNIEKTQEGQQALYFI